MADVEHVLDALGEPTRRHLLRLLLQHRDCTVTELVHASGLRQPQVSKHLRVLSDASLVTCRADSADGRLRRYRLDGEGLEVAHDWFASFEDVWHARFDALDDLVSTNPHPPTPEERQP